MDRDIQRRAILSLGAYVLNPIYGADPELWFEEALRANKIDPLRLKLSDKKKANIQQEAVMRAQAQANAVAQQQENAQYQIQQEKDKLILQAALKDAEIKKDIIVAHIAHPKS